MILKGAQRGGATQMANHLLKTDDNEHVEIHEISGFVADDLHGALNEIYAISRGTKCTQFMFSVSLNPPQTENAPVEYFEKAIADIEEKNGLKGQPRAIVFHEKEGRRHGHCVWSRIDTEKMKAINLPYYKMKLQDISKQLYFQYGWQMPRGFLNKEERDPLNFTLGEWQQGKRLKEDPKVIISIFQECWAVSDSKEAFADALKENGYTLARGDRRGFVAVDHHGEVFSLSRKIGLKPKQIKERLGDGKDLQSVAEAKADIAEKITDHLRRYIHEVKTEAIEAKQPLRKKKQALVKHHRTERAILATKQKNRCQEETKTRAQRLPRGLKGLWYRITGQYKKIKAQNERETASSRIRDRDEKQNLIHRQLKERQTLQEEFQIFRQDYNDRLRSLKQDIARYAEMSEGAQKTLLETHEPSSQPVRSRSRNYDPEM